jgi:hypothetical protein
VDARSAPLRDAIAHRLDPIVIEVDDAGISGSVTLPTDLAGERVSVRLKESHDQEPQPLILLASGLAFNA